MTLKQIEERVERIRRMAGDDEAAHSEEDELRHDFIEYVASLPIPLAKKAWAVLETSGIRFARWCA